MAQTERGIEIIVCDDRGPDSAAAQSLVESYKDSRIKFHRNEKNLGLGGNWNKCLDRAATDLVTILHADDRLTPEYASLMIGAAARYPDVTAFHCDARIIDASSKPTFSAPDFYKKLIRARPPEGGDLIAKGDASLANLLKGWSIMCPTVCYRRSLLGKRRFQPSWRMVVDVELMAGLLLDGHTLIGLPTAAYEYRRHSGNQTSLLTKELTRFEEERAIYDLIQAKAAKLGWNQTVAVCAKKRIIKLNLMYCVLIDLIRLRFSFASRKLRLLKKLNSSSPDSASIL